jgi:hypothetical protein
LLGGLLGGQSSTQGATNTTNPYAPAQPWINQNINSGMSLQKQYQAQPLSLGQLEAYGNAQGLSDGFRSQAGSLTNQMNGMRQFDRNDPTQRATQFNFTDAPADQQKSMQSFVSSLPETSQLDLGRRISEGGLLGNPQGGSSSGSFRTIEDGGNQWGGIGTGYETDRINSDAMDTFKKVAPYSALGGLGASLVQKYLAQRAELGRANASADPIAHLNSIQGWTNDGRPTGSSWQGMSGHYGQNYGNDAYSMGPSQTNQADTSLWGTPITHSSNGGGGGMN